MTPALFTYTLPTLQLVCHLVAPGNPSIGTGISGIIEPLSPTPTPRALPPGYVAYPDFNVAYKVHDERVSWNVAEERCVQEGGHLAVIDSSAKIQLVKSQPAADTHYVHVGLYLKDGDDSTWYSASTGLPVSNLPWSSGEPNGSGRCVQIRPSSSSIGLGKYSCTDSEVYVCEISYP